MTSPEPDLAQPPEGASLAGLRAAAAGCTACELGRQPGVRTVFSTGSATARLALVGEQPGDVEDREGAPFVGPAGRLLDRALAEAGVERADTYVTNAVKHFFYQLTGGSGSAAGRSGQGKRIHRTPEALHVAACRPWLISELRIVDPEVCVLLGATAARSLLGPDVRVTRDRGVLIPRPTHPGEPARVALAWFLVTLHPAAVLRADDQDSAYASLVADLRVAASALA